MQHKLEKSKSKLTGTIGSMVDHPHHFAPDKFKDVLAALAESEDGTIKTKVADLKKLVKPINSNPRGAGRTSEKEKVAKKKEEKQPLSDENVEKLKKFIPCVRITPEVVNS